jgi:O-antigen/teichoic acid export membrane protein
MSLSTLADKYCPTVCRPVLNRVQQSPIGKRIASGTFWSVAGNGFGKMFTFIAMVLVARILSKEAFGEFGLVRSTASMFVAFSGFGMGLTATKYIAELLHTDKERVGRVIGLTYVFTFFTSLIVAITFYLISPWLCETQLGKPELTSTMRLGTALLFLTTFMGTQTAVMTGFQDFRGLAIMNILVGLITIPIYVICTYCNGLRGAIIAVVFASVLNLMINSKLIYKNTKKYQVNYNFRNAYKEFSIIGQSNLPITLGVVTTAMAYWIVQMILAKQPDGISQLSIYYAVLNYQLAISFFPSQLTQVFFPILNELNSTRRYWYVVPKMLLINFSISLLIVCPFLVFSKYFMSLYGAEFINGWLTLCMAGLAVVASTISGIFYQIILSLGLNWTQFFINFFCMAIFVYITNILIMTTNLRAGSIFCSYIICSLIYCFFSIIALVFLTNRISQG